MASSSGKLVATMSSGHVQVLSNWVSMFGMRVVIALKEKGVDYDYHEENLFNKSQLLLSANPILKKVPVLMHNGRTVLESLIAVEYIDESWPSENKCLLPKDPYQRAVARFWADFVDKKIALAGNRIIKSPEGELRDQATQDFSANYITMDAAVRDVTDGKPYFGGDSIGLVDIALAPFICWFKAYEVLGNFKLPDAKECPHLNAWVKRVLEYPSVKEATAPAQYDKVVEFAQNLRKRRLGA